MTLDELKKILPTIPEEPGCYQYYDSEGQIIYVGKAKNLRRRVSSYFNKEHPDRKTRRLVRSISDLRYFVVHTEADALLLENNLIKTHNPKYNILLKDGKSYPSIVLTKEEYPRIFQTRKADPEKHIIFGPYTEATIPYKLLQLIREMFYLRTCRLALNEEAIRKGKFSTCLQYHIKKCKAPCVGYISKEEYRYAVKEAAELLSGNLGKLIAAEEKEMVKASKELRFEEAGLHKTKIDRLRNYRAKHTVATPSLGNLEVYAYDENETQAFVCMLQLREGAIIRALTDAWRKPIDESKEDILASIITDLRKQYPFSAKELLLSTPTDWLPVGVEKARVIYPQRGEKRKLLQLAEENVQRYKRDSQIREEKLNPEQRATRLLNKMKEDLRLKQLPRHIECFDNSNVQGTNPVAACVVFRNGKPLKREYRKFHVKTVIGANDYASMKEIVARRYNRIRVEGEALPDLIVVDGGKGQLRFACEALDSLSLLGKVPIIGLAERIEEVYFPEEAEPLFLKRDSETLNVLRHIRDEAHRFGVTFHRGLRSKKQIKSRLDEIPGVGEKTKEKLLKHFKSAKQIALAPLKELQETVGEKTGEVVFEYLHAKQILEEFISSEGKKWGKKTTEQET